MSDDEQQMTHSDKVNVGRVLSDFIIQKYLIITVLVFRIFYAFLLSGLQYYVWSRGGVGKFLLPPYQSMAYFLQYSWTHFFMNAIWSVGAALVFYVILKMIEKRIPDFFKQNEVEFGFLCALIIGWPGIVVFVPVFLMILLSGTLLSKFTNLARRVPSWCTVSLAFLLAVLIVMIFQDQLLNIFNLAVLKI